MADLFKALKPEKHLSKSGFDLSQKHVFSSKAGQAVPCLAVETVPDDYFEIDLASLVRTQTLNTAAFLRGKMRYDFFFVPNSQLWHMFNQFITQRKDVHSTLSKGAKFCPNVQLSAILQMIVDDTTSQDIQGYKWSYNAVRLLDMLGYGNHSVLLNPDVLDAKKTSYINRHSGQYVNIFRLAAYQHIWYDFYRNKYYDTGDSGVPSSVDVGDYVSFFNFDDIDCSTVANSHIPVSTSDDKARVRGLLGMRYVQWKKDLFTSAMPGQQFGVVSAVSLNLPNITFKGDGTVVGVTQGLTDDVLEYGYKSADDTYKYVSSPPHVGHVCITSDNDDDTKIALQAQLSNGEEGAGWKSLLHKHNIAGRNVITRNGESVGITSSYSSSASFDVLSLYKAQMLQNWKQATLRAGNMTDDNFRAHFGVTPRYEGDENVDYLGSFDASLQVNAVESTATTGETINGKVGELGATGTAVAQGTKIRYKARDFGIIMCISSFLPEAEYNANMLDKANTLLEEFDYFTPEFENIGLEAIPASAYDNNAFVPNANMGYAPRYWMYKTAIDKVHGEFSSTLFYTIPDDPSSGVLEQGSLSPWVAPRLEQYYGLNLSVRKLSSFYVQPSVYNNVLGITADGSQTTDYLLNNVFFDIKAIRPMSVLGLPQF